MRWASPAPGPQRYPYAVVLAAGWAAAGARAKAAAPQADSFARMEAVVDRHLAAKASQ